MTSAFISLLLTIAPALFPWVEDWLLSQPDTPAADVVCLRFPHSVAKDHSLGQTAPTLLVVPGSLIPRPLEDREPEWPRISGRSQDVVCHDVHRLAVVEGCTVVQHRAGGFSVYSQYGSGRESLHFSTLEEVNSQLISHGIAAQSDADFRTFEELAEERSRRRVTWSLVGIAIGIVTLAGVVLVAMWRRRSWPE